MNDELIKRVANVQRNTDMTTYNVIADMEMEVNRLENATISLSDELDVLWYENKHLREVVESNNLFLDTLTALVGVDGNDTHEAILNTVVDILTNLAKAKEYIPLNKQEAFDLFLEWQSTQVLSIATYHTLITTTESEVMKRAGLIVKDGKQ